MKYFKIFETDELILGITLKKELVIETNNRIELINSSQKYIYILPILYQPIDEFIFLLEEKIFNSNETNITIELVKSLVIYNFIAKIFSNKDISSYWIELAFNWFKEFPMQEKEKCIKELNRIIKNKKYSHDVLPKKYTEF